MKEIRKDHPDKTLRLSDEMLATALQIPEEDSAKQQSPAPFSIRFTFEERAKLERAAGSKPLGAFIREKLFEGDLTPRRTRGHEPIKDHKELGRVLGALGASRLSSNLNQIAKAANMGALPVTPDLEEKLQTACDEIRKMRTDLMNALGFSESKEPS